MDRTVPLLDDDPFRDFSQNHIIFKDSTIMNGWLRAIETTVSGRIAQAVSPKMDRPIQIIDGLYLGRLVHAKDSNALSTLGITHLLDCSTSHIHDSITTDDISAAQTPAITPRPGMGLAKRSLLMSFGDSQSSAPACTHISDLADGPKHIHFNSAVRHINSILDKPGAKLLAFCLSGINRSAAVCVATLMSRQNFPLLKSLISVRDKTGPIIQMPGIQRQLLEFAVEISRLDDVRQWPPEEDDMDIEREMFEDWQSVSSSGLRPDDEDLDSDDRFSEIAYDGSVHHLSPIKNSIHVSSKRTDAPNKNVPNKNVHVPNKNVHFLNKNVHAPKKNVHVSHRSPNTPDLLI